MSNLLEGRRVLITGASSGVGAAAAEAFAQAGADVALLARRKGALESTARRVREHGREAVVVPADVTDRAAIARAVATAVERLGGLDVVVLNAANTAFGDFRTTSPDDFDAVMATSFGGAVNVVRATLPELERTAGVIVATGSLMTRVPLPTFSSYAAAKHAERGFLNTLRVELRAEDSPVQIAMVHPGAIDTGIWDKNEADSSDTPRRPPLASDPATVANALVQAAADPRPEVTVGLDAIALSTLFAHARPVAETVLTAVRHFYVSDERQSDTQAGFRAVSRAVSQSMPSLSDLPRRLAGAPGVWGRRLAPPRGA
jgi:NAD(P)-dependent dehydrogenase (short-subunit alcohol dehydrogenase family)